MVEAIVRSDRPLGAAVAGRDLNIVEMLKRQMI